MRAGDVRAPSSATMTPAGFLVPACFQIGEVPAVSFAGFGIEQDGKLIEQAMFPCRATAEGYAAGMMEALSGTPCVWEDAADEGWEIVPYRVAATKVNA